MLCSARRHGGTPTAEAYGCPAEWQVDDLALFTPLGMMEWPSGASLVFAIRHGSSFIVSRICCAGDGHETGRGEAALKSIHLPFCGGAFGRPLGCCLSEGLFVIGWGFGDKGGRT